MMYPTYLRPIAHLTYNSPIRSSAWGRGVFARVFTVAGYALSKGKDPSEAVHDAAKLGHEITGSIYSSGALVGDKAAGARKLAEEKAIAASAVTLQTGDVVAIDGVLFRVRYVFPKMNELREFPDNCDPVHFDPVV